MTKRTRKKRKRGWTPPIDYKFGPNAVARMLSRQEHLKTHPNCPYEGPHFVPPSFGQKGFFMCEVPADLTRELRIAPKEEDNE